MSRLILVLPNQQQILIQVADDTLVYNGKEYVQPQDAKVVALYDMPVAAKTLPFEQAVRDLLTRAYIEASVIGFNPISSPASSLSVVTEPDPSLGECVCFVTCKGTWLSYVQVVQEPQP